MLQYGLERGIMISTITVSIATVTILLMSATTMTTTNLMKGAVASLRVRAAVQ